MSTERLLGYSARAWCAGAAMIAAADAATTGRWAAFAIWAVAWGLITAWVIRSYVGDQRAGRVDP